MNRLLRLILRAFAALGESVYAHHLPPTNEISDKDVRVRFDAIVRREWGREAAAPNRSRRTRAADFDRKADCSVLRHIQPW